MFDSVTFENIYECRDSHRYLTCLKFSSDGKILAVASSDTNIYLYDGFTFESRCVCESHNARILSLDFSADGYYLQSSSIDHELFYRKSRVSLDWLMIVRHRCGRHKVYGDFSITACGVVKLDNGFWELCERYVCPFRSIQVGGFRETGRGLGPG